MEKSHNISETAEKPLAKVPSLRLAGRVAYFWRGTLPYVTEIIRVSTSSGDALKANSRAMISSTPCWLLVFVKKMCIHSCQPQLTWVGIDDDTVLGSHDDKKAMLRNYVSGYNVMS
jgi:hypothetical protein